MIGKNVENDLININPVKITSSVTNMETILVTISAMSPVCPRAVTGSVTGTKSTIFLRINILIGYLEYTNYSIRFKFSFCYTGEINVNFMYEFLRILILNNFAEKSYQVIKKKKYIYFLLV